PTAAKLRAVARTGGRAVVVVNAAEGEPASLKDVTALELVPHLVLDGAVLAAHAVGADEVEVCVCGHAREAIGSALQAIDERASAPAYADFAGPARMRVTPAPGHYVAGQETPPVNFLSRGPALPLFTPPMPFERGVRRRPTLISNAETLAHLA